MQIEPSNLYNVHQTNSNVLCLQPEILYHSVYCKNSNLTAFTTYTRFYLKLQFLYPSIVSILLIVRLPSFRLYELCRRRLPPIERIVHFNIVNNTSHLTTLLPTTPSSRTTTLACLLRPAHKYYKFCTSKRSLNFSIEQLVDHHHRPQPYIHKSISGVETCLLCVLKKGDFCLLWQLTKRPFNCKLTFFPIMTNIFLYLIIFSQIQINVIHFSRWERGYFIVKCELTYFVAFHFILTFKMEVLISTRTHRVP